MTVIPATTPGGRRVHSALPEGLAWVGRATMPSDEEIQRALQVMAAVPLAAAVGWSVNGHPWSCHPRRLRTAIVRPSGEWSIEVMRGVREVDCLSGPMIVRRTHLERIEPRSDDRSWREGERRKDADRSLSRALRSSGFRLLFLGER